MGLVVNTIDCERGAHLALYQQRGAGRRTCSPPGSAHAQPRSLRATAAPRSLPGQSSERARHAWSLHWPVTRHDAPACASRHSTNVQRPLGFSATILCALETYCSVGDLGIYFIIIFLLPNSVTAQESYGYKFHSWRGLLCLVKPY